MKQMKKLFVLFVCMLVFCACADTEQKMQKTVEDTADKVEDRVEDTLDSGERSMDDLMNYLNEAQIGIEQEEVIEDIPFAAYEGRSFMINGNRVYLYRINKNDGDMQMILQQLQEDGMVSVERNGQKMKYQGKLSNDYLLLFDPGVDTGTLVDTLQRYPA